MINYVLKRCCTRLALFFLAFSAFAEENKESIHIQIVTEHLPPFQIENKGRVLGFATEIIRAALSNTPFTYSIASYPWTRSLKMAESKENTCIYSIARTPDREDKFIWVNTIASRDASFVALTERSLAISSFNDAKHYKTAVIRDDVTHQYLLNEGFEEGKNLYIVNNTHSLLKLLSLREGVDLILVDANTIEYRARFNGLAPELFEKVYQINEEPMDYYLACNPKTLPNVIKGLRSSIDKMKNSGQLQLIIDEWQYPTLKVENN